MWSYLLSLLLPISAIAFISFGHPGLFLLTVVAVVPVLDMAIGRMKHREIVVNEKSSGYLAAFHIPHMYQTIWLGVLFVAAQRSLHASPAEFALIAACCAMMAAFVSVPAHEFMHRDCEHSRAAADFAFALIGYGHFTVLHHIHHVKPGQNRFGHAPALGVSVWRHFPASWWNGVTAAWRAEFRKGGWHPWRNRVLRQWTVTLGGMGVFLAACGERGLILFVVQAMFAVFFVEVAGYIQHYGFEHDENDPYTKDLAWDSDHWLSNRLLINNPLHAHHHRDARAVYMTLQPVAPRLPAGYFVMLWAALVPPLWYSIMNRRVIDMVETNG